MNRFELARAASVAQAQELLGEQEGSLVKAGGIDLLDHLKEHLVEPPRLVDIKRIPGLDRVEFTDDGGLRVGPLVTLAKIGAHKGVRKTHTALAEACGKAASPQIRNVATIGGNILQRPRCWYYRLESYECLKKGGDTCFAMYGENRYHSILGGGPCFALHPSNAAVALAAFDASLVFEGPKEPRTIAAADFFVSPGTDPERENAIQPSDVLTEIRIPPASGTRSGYADVRERSGFDWPLASVATVVRTSGGVVKSARVVLGAVAPVPWIAKAAEKALQGSALDEAAAGAAAKAAVEGAEPLSDNGYKVELVQTLVRRTLLALA